MFEMMKPLATWDDMWQNMIALTEYPFAGKTLKDTGLRKLISRPHNIVNVTDENGDVVEQRLEVVTTPFKKDQVVVEVSNNTLTVKCGKEETEELPQEVKDEKETKKEVKTENYLYKGISSQYYTFSLKLSDKVDRAGIKAKNVDGVLTVTLPFKKENAPEVAQITVE